LKKKLLKREWRFGVRRLKDFNLSLLCEWVRRVLEERESLWYKVLSVRYGEEGGRLCFGGSGRSAWWQNLNHIRTWKGMVEEQLLLNNIQRVVGDGMYMLFWRYLWLVGSLLDVQSSRLFIVAEMYGLR
jgi:hypothetical protein